MPIPTTPLRDSSRISTLQTPPLSMAEMEQSSATAAVEQNKPERRSQDRKALLDDLRAHQAGPTASEIDPGLNAFQGLGFSQAPSDQGLHGNLDQKMLIVHHQFIPLFKKAVGPEVFDHAQPILNALSDPNVQFEERRQLVNAFVDRYKESHPTAIRDLGKMIDCQLRVYGVAENQTAAQQTQRGGDIDSSVQALIEHFGKDPKTIHRELARLTVTPVLTAHPTLLQNPLSVARLNQVSKELDQPTILREICGELWEMSGGRSKRPSVLNEAENNTPHLERMHREARRGHKTMDKSIKRHLGTSGTIQVNPMIHVDSWIGGDRDGNELVTAALMSSIVLLQAEVALERCEKKLDSNKSQEDGSLRSLLDLHAPGEAARIVARIGATKSALSSNGMSELFNDDLSVAAYKTPNKLIADLETLKMKLPTDDDRSKLSRFIREIDGFGFHGASIDVRQNSAIHQQSVAELLNEAGIVSSYDELTEDEKQAVLWEQLTTPQENLLYQPQGKYSAQTRKEMEIMQAIKEIHTQYGSSAMPNYIIANTDSVSDILEPMLLIKQVGLAGPDGLKMNIVPLIETVPDLQNGRAMVGKLLEQKQYREWLKERDNIQQIMLGYSDSTRLDGITASNWETYKAQEYLQEVAAENGVELLVFHGRGGTVARGAGLHPQQEVDMLAAGSAKHGLRFTEQGEEILSKYGSPEAAGYHLQTMTAAAINANIPRAPVETKKYHDSMEAISKRSSEVYRQLIGSRGFVDYYNQASPVGYVTHLNAGSRAASRGNLADGQLSLDQLRAIPWVAGWNQSRGMVPAWYGMGSALSEHVASDTGAPVTEPKLNQLREMYQQWPFFRALVDRTENELAKVDLDIMKGYAGLVKNGEVSNEIYNDLKNEFLRTKEMVLAIKQQKILLELDTTVAINNKRKAPLVDTANALQIALIKAEREEENNDVKQKLTEGVVTTMQAIQSGLGRFG